MNCDKLKINISFLIQSTNKNEENVDKVMYQETIIQIIW